MSEPEVSIRPPMTAGEPARSWPASFSHPSLPAAATGLAYPAVLALVAALVMKRPLRIRTAGPAPSFVDDRALHGMLLDH
jgi:hypothetical protein